ncbi:lamin tail domain-containing protein [Geofilum sp. OHC36d9]|uniref:lamin tail domain-containing protein n=1 Tax=Geofilum sp. OHC36d9 TaxID=3458413 RepID=UPI0040347D50
MRPFFILTLLFLSVNISAQFADDFSDGNFSQDPVWEGCPDLFVVDMLEAALQLNAPAEAGQAWLFTPSKAMDDAVWQFSFRMDFNPSSANFAQVFLASDAIIPSEVKMGLYLVLGTSADNISLWELRNGIKKELITGQEGRLDSSKPEGRVRVKRDKSGIIVLEADVGDGWVEEGRVVNHEGYAASWTGVDCHYTATRSTLFWFDDFVVTGSAYRDTVPPVVQHFEVRNQYLLRLSFSEPLSGLLYEPGHFLIQPGSLLPDIVTTDNESGLMLLYRHGIAIGNDCRLEVSGVSDVDGNQLNDTVLYYQYVPAQMTDWRVTSSRLLTLCFSHSISDFLTQSARWATNGPDIKSVQDLGDGCYQLLLSSDYPRGESLQLLFDSLVATNGDTISGGPYDFWYYPAQRNDLVISEMMTDPDPVVKLPNSEFIELFNRCDYPVYLKNYQLIIGDRTATLTDGVIFPGDYLLLIPASKEGVWDSTSSFLPVANWPALANSEGVVFLKNNEGTIVTSLKYSKEMGAEGFKQGGGWSMEMMDVDNLSGDFDNWGWSGDLRGGTPGAANSLLSFFPDLKPPAFLGWYWANDSSVVLEFSEPVTSGFLSPVEKLSLSPSLVVDEAGIDSAFLSSAILSFADEWPDNEQFYLELSESPCDLAGNEMVLPDTIRLARPVVAAPFDFVINELLFDPTSDMVDFVELYNRGDRVLDLSELFIARDNIEGIPEELVPLTDEVRAFFPGEYLVFTSDREVLLEKYDIADPWCVFSVTGFPNFVNGEGIVFITDRSGQTLDRFNYSENLHFALLSSTKGVSLERVDVNGSSNSVVNWHSAAADVNYATPTLRNSQAVDGASETSATFVLEPDVFTPNLDGVDDLLFIRYHFPEAGYSCFIDIFNRNGIPVRRLVNNQLAGTSGFFAWDGTDDENALCKSGIYIILIKWFNLKGEVKEEKQVVVLGVGR